MNQDKDSDCCKVWCKFESKRKDGSVIKLRIQDLPKDREEDCIAFLVKYFVKDEAFHIAAGISQSTEAVEEYVNLIKTFNEAEPLHITMCCVDDESNKAGEIIGISSIQIGKKEDNFKDFIRELELKTEEMKKLFHIIEVLENYVNQWEYEFYYEGRGIIVHPDYRGLGIANEFVRVRKQICIENDLPMTCAWMTSIGTQKAAEKHRWRIHAEISLEELDRMTGLTFEKKVPTYKLMYTTKD